MPDWRALVRAKLRALEIEPTRKAEIVEELAQHAEDRYRELRSRGLSDAEATREAVDDATGSRTLFAELRDIARSGPSEPAVLGAAKSRWFGGLAHDLRYAARAIRRSPGFALVAILSLALGSGADTAIFQLLDAVRLRSLPVDRPDELVTIRIGNLSGRSGSFSGTHPEFSFPLWTRIRDRQEALAGVYAWSEDRFDLGLGGDIREAQGLWVSGGFFTTLGVQATRGRLLVPEDDEPGCGSPGAVISDAFWRREFGADPAILDRTVSLDGTSFPIIGVSAASFFGVEVGRRFDVAIPLCADPLLPADRSRVERTDSWWLAVGGRLKPGWSRERATAQLGAISGPMFAETLPSDYSPEQAKAYRAGLLEAIDGGAGRSVLRGAYSDPLWFLLGIGGLVLLIACANLANLLLSRATARQREIAARLALGASRARLLRQLLIESLLLSFAGVVAGLGLAQALTRFLMAMLSTTADPLFLDLGLNLRVFGFAALVVVATCLVFGLGPAIRAIGVAPMVAMRAGGRTLSAGRDRRLIERGLVVAQVALSLTLLVTALLFVRSFRKLVTLDPGFRKEGIVIAWVDVTPLKLEPERQYQQVSELVDRIRAIPGVSSAATVTHLPATDSWSNDHVEVDGPGGPKEGVLNETWVSAGYFETLGIPLVAGRDFNDHDVPAAPNVAIVNQSFVAKFLGGGTAIGRSFVTGSPPGQTIRYEIIGIVRDTKYRQLREPIGPIAFLAAAQIGSYDRTYVVVRSGERLATLGPAIRRTVAAVDQTIRLYQTEFSTQIQEGLKQERLMAALSGFFGVLAVTLAVVGLYGVVSYMVSRRTNEMGIRMALGAESRRIVSMVLKEALGLIGFGLALGVAIAAFATRALESMIYGLDPRDPTTFVLALGLLVGTGLLAGYLPARKAALVDPVTALRQE